MQYIFIYYNIIYLILLVLIFIYIKNILNNCYNIEYFDYTNNQDNTNNPDSTSSPIDDIDIIFSPILQDDGRKKRKILSVLENNERKKYNVDPKNKTNINDIKLYKSEYDDAEKLANELKNKL